MLYKGKMLSKDNTISKMRQIYTFSQNACERLYDYYNNLDIVFDIENDNHLKYYWKEYKDAKTALYELCRANRQDVVNVCNMTRDESEACLRKVWATLYSKIDLVKVYKQNGYLINYKPLRTIISRY